MLRTTVTRHPQSVAPASSNSGHSAAVSPAWILSPLAANLLPNGGSLVERRLAAILAADVVGYSRLMGADEAGTLERLKSLHSELVRPKITGRGGRIVKLMGDGNNNRDRSIVLEGHCDERGTREYNLALGENRSNAVRSFLTSAGVSPRQIETVSYGEERPDDPGHSEAAWERNRRAIMIYR